MKFLTLHSWLLVSAEGIKRKAPPISNLTGKFVFFRKTNNILGKTLLQILSVHPESFLWGKSMPKARRKIIFELLITLGVPLVSSACASREITIKTTPASASVVALDFDLPSKRIELGKGEFKIQIDALAGKSLMVEAKDQESLLVVPLNVSPSEILTLNLKPKSTEMEKKISELETKLEVEKRNAQALAEKLALFEKERHRAAQLVARLQNSITQNSVTKANALANELFKISDTLLPAVAYTLRGKLRLIEQKRAEARQDFTRALQISPLELEAKTFLDTLK